MKSGIYGIKNAKNGRMYIGSTICFEERWKQHKRELEKGTHHSIKLQRAWNKYGSDAFTFAVLEAIHNTELLFQFEQMWMDAENSVQKGYNVAAKAGFPGRPYDPLFRDPNAIARPTGKNMSKYAQFPDKESKQRLYDGLLEKLQKKSELRKWPANVYLKRIARLALDQWIDGGCSVCHGVACVQWEDEDLVRHKIECAGCNGTGMEPIKCNRHEEPYIFDTMTMLESYYKEICILTEEQCANNACVK